MDDIIDARYIHEVHWICILRMMRVIYFNVDISIWRTGDILVVCHACDFSQTFWLIIVVCSTLPLIRRFASLYLFSISTVLKTYGQHLKAPAAMVRLRLYETLSLLPSHTFEGNLYEHQYKIELIFSCSVLTTAVAVFSFIIWLRGLRFVWVYNKALLIKVHWAKVYKLWV